MLRSAELEREVTDRSGTSVELMQLRHGIFDDAPVSIITETTAAGIAREAGMDVDCRRFRANILLDARGVEPFVENSWIGATLLFGDTEPRPAVRVTARDARCVMINMDPDTAVQDPRMLKTVVRLNQNDAGVYGTVIQTGAISVGDAVTLVR